MTQAPGSDDWVIELARPGDGPGAYAVCLRTGDSGRDATALFRDPEALGHLYVGPYLSLEPRLAFALRRNNKVVGYTLGALDTPSFHARLQAEWFPPLRLRLPDPRPPFAAGDFDAVVFHEIHHPRLSFPAALASFPSHMHIDLLPEAQGQGWGGKMVGTLLAALAEMGSPGVHLGVAADNRRAIRFYEKLGFRELFRERNPLAETVCMGLILPT